MVALHGFGVDEGNRRAVYSFQILSWGENETELSIQFHFESEELKPAKKNAKLIIIRSSEKKQRFLGKIFVLNMQ